jgi:outer membrane protein insertion porin family
MRKILLLLLLLSCAVCAYANNSFIVQRIQINGLQGISRTTVLSYLPVKVGDHLTPEKNQQIIRALFRTNFFSNVNLARQNGTLIINVQQRPIIGQIKIVGNKLIPTKKLRAALKKNGFVEGQVFDRSVLAKIKASLVREYFIVGKYNAKVNVKVTPQKRHRVAVHIIISEGKTAKIYSIKIIGNKVFRESLLLHQFKLSPSHLFSFFTHNDEYNLEKLNKDLESLRSFYMDKGYIKFKILLSQVSLTPDRKHIYITIRIHEGGQYRVSGFAIDTKTPLPLSKSKIAELIQKEIKPNMIFSRKALLQSYKNVSQALGVKGYADAVINALPKIDDKKHTVFLHYIIKPGPKIYVRRITFSGNYRTNDETFRRELRQMEGGLLTPQNVEESKRNLLNLPYVKGVDVITTPAPGKPNMVDMNYRITGTSAATLQGGIGYSQIDRFSLNGSITQKNLLGTGNWLGLSAYYSHPQISLDLNYYNPYITPSHIGRSIHVYATKFNANRANITDYTTNVYGAAVTYNFPLSEYQSFSLGGGIEHDTLELGSNPALELQNFANKHGKHFYQGILDASWSYQNFDRYLFPTRGSMLSASTSITVPVSAKDSLEYYKVDLSGIFYYPLYKEFIGKLSATTGYGDGYGKFKTLPFFKNYYAGGIGTVRGYEGNSLGPKDSTGQVLGGKFVAYGTAELIFPNFISQTLRTGWFVDAGNVYKRITLADIRCSTGLEVDWKSPMGVINFALAKALNARKGDDTNVFQF